jgi:ATP-binding cassette subfamily B protein
VIVGCARSQISSFLSEMVEWRSLAIFLMEQISFRQILAFLWSYFGRFKLQVFLAFLAVSLSSAADIFSPLLLGELIDTVTKDSGFPLSERYHHAFWLLLLLLILSLFFHVVYRVAHFLNSWTDSRVERLVAAEALDKVQRFSADWHANSFSGATVTKIKRAMRATHEFYDLFCYELYPTICIMIGLIVLSLMRQPVLGLVFAVFSLFYFFLSVLFALFYVAPAKRQENVEDNKLGAALADTLSSNSIVKSFAGESRENRHFEKISSRWMNSAFRAWTRANIASLIQNICISGLKFSLLFGAVWYFFQGVLTTGDVVFFFTSYGLFTAYIRNIGDRIRTMHQAANDMEDVVRFHQTHPDVKDSTEAKKLSVHKGKIDFEAVTFGYENPGIIFEDFSLMIQPGEKIALVGHSGSGKTTFVKLIQRLYDVQSGRILIDGQDINQVTQKSLRQSIALVPQDPILFHRSLLENIAYGRPDATQQEIERAAKQAHLDELIRNLPKGYETLVGERGIKLSGGERQRVAIARAILADRPILILDEATSSLDSHSEQMIKDALAHLLQRRTAIIIAHRLSTIKAVDRILVFEGGKIVEQGTHTQLLRRSAGIYRRLYKLQASGFLGEEDPI